MHDQFHDWDQRVLKKPKKRLRKAQRELEKIMSGPMNDESESKRKELSELIEFLLELEEILLGNVVISKFSYAHARSW